MYRWIIILSCIVKYAHAQPEMDFIYFDESDIKIADHISDIHEDGDGYLWLANYEGGLIRYDGYEFRYYISDVRDSSSIASPNVFSFHETSTKEKWIGYRNAVSWMQEDSMLTYSLGYDELEVGRNYINDFLERDKNHIWVGTNVGLALLDKSNGSHILFRDTINTELNPFRTNRIYRTEPSHKPGHLWIGSGQSLKEFNISTGTFTSFRHPEKWHNIGPVGEQLAIVDMDLTLEDRIVMAGGYHGGIFIYDYAKDEWKQFLHQDADPDDPAKYHKVQSINVLNDSTILFTSYFGLGYIDFKTEVIRYLNNFESNRLGRIRESIIDKNGILWLAGTVGIARTQEPITSPINNTFKPIIVRIDVDGENMKGEIPHAFRDLDIEVRAINPPLEDFQYRWKLAGFDKEWKFSTENRVAHYTNLDGGDYTFHYQTSKDGSVWTAGEPFALSIQKGIFEQWLTWIIILSVAIFILFSIMEFIKRKTAKKLERQKKLVEAELSALRSQMNPHFIFNSLNSIYNFIHLNETDSAAEYLSKFSKLMRLVLQNSKEKLVTLQDELQVTTLYLELEQLRFDCKFDYSIVIDENIDTELLELPPLIIQPYLENAIWHGLMHKEGRGNIDLKIIEVDEKRMEIIISDNGVGRVKSRDINAHRERKSMGMDITRKRLEAFEILHDERAKIEILDLAPGEGTIVKINLPKLLRYASHNSR